ncbi:hypothetical protein DAEQUDRAFT_695584 [Daedalea quercina L-15889]|uniref:Uncharacterized protein n=1 Tax=Daedalea quercina L-15889 TaxID=1314783 RepID=A0A165N2P4_9APHY|nr:hypothetical protein DAEQUDRAFT_695584 [Daedalea quercina L-15889]
MPQVPLVSSNLATVLIESFLYGIFMALSLTSIYLLIQRKMSKKHGHTIIGVQFYWLSPMLVGSIAMVITVTGHWICTAIRLFQAFVIFERGTQALDFYTNSHEVTEVVKTAFLVATGAIGDVLTIYRLWIIWNHNTWVIIFPLLTFSASVVCGVGLTYQTAHSIAKDDIFVPAVGHWITSNATFTFCINVYCSVMIVWRIWCAHLSIKRYRTGSLLSSLAIFIESALLFMTWSLLFIITYHIGTNVQFLVVDTWPAITGIALMLITVRVGMGWALTASQVTSAITTGTAHMPQQDIESSYPMHQLAVNIVHTVDQDDGVSTTQKGYHVSIGHV